MSLTASGHWCDRLIVLCLGSGPRPRSTAPIHTSAPDAPADTCRTSDQDPLRVQYGGTGGGGPWLLRGLLQGKSPLINHSMRRMARYGTQRLKWNLVVVSEAAIRLLLNASCPRLSPMLAKLAAATAKLTSLNSARQPLVFGFCCGLASYVDWNKRIPSTIAYISSRGWSLIGINGVYLQHPRAKS